MDPRKVLPRALALFPADLWHVASAERAWQAEKSQDYAVQKPIREQPVQRKLAPAGRAGRVSRPRGLGGERVDDYPRDHLGRASGEGNLVWVRAPPPAPRKSPAKAGEFFFRAYLTYWAPGLLCRSQDRSRHSLGVVLEAAYADSLAPLTTPQTRSVSLVQSNAGADPLAALGGGDGRSVCSKTPRTQRRP